ncbi:MAG: hypothetical protein LBQ36_01560 [Synergistaceae bacterium]|jgi:hypothetical protein|nr:hypothetical protein [Synergistaceae bacterium]
MPFELFDRSELRLRPLSEREHDLDLSVMFDPKDVKPTMNHPTIKILADRIVEARKTGAAVILALGAHVLREGNGPLLAELMKRGLVTHIALNGAGAIHDYEFALIGQTTESVARYISEGQFGLWAETGGLNDCAKTAARDKIGFGEAIGKAIEEGEFPHRSCSLLAAGYRFRVPVTVHVSIGSDIIHEHPNCDGAALGGASYTDFLIYARSVANLENGVFLEFGSAVMGPEVYLKCLAMARNVAHQHGRRIARFTTAVFDLHDLEGRDISETPPKDDPRYYFRPWKTILARTVADGGEGFYVRGRHSETVPNLYAQLLEKSGKGGV